jgi:hypothetical protein
MSLVITADRTAEYASIVRLVVAWASRQRDIVAVVVVGSWARGEAHMGSDVDLMVVTEDKARYLSDGSWVPLAADGPAELASTLTGVRSPSGGSCCPSGLEVEFGFVPPSWASTAQVDPGTARVIGNGCSTLVDRDGTLAHLVRAVAST